MCLKTESRPGCLADNSEMGEEEGPIMQSFISYYNRKLWEGFKQGSKVIWAPFLKDHFCIEEMIL